MMLCNVDGIGVCMIEYLFVLLFVCEIDYVIVEFDVEEVLIFDGSVMLWVDVICVCGCVVFDVLKCFICVLWLFVVMDGDGD